MRSALRATLMLGLPIVLPAPANAGAVTDGSVGPVQSLSGHFTIPQTLGSVSGGNLFHSFAAFNVANGESAMFTTASAGIGHVIARVTGGQPSAIYGPLSLQAASGSHPDLFFINPAGMLFGAGAKIDVPGGFHVSTAQQLKFADGFVWATGSPTTSSLTIAAPESFGFLGGSARAAVTFSSLDSGGNAGDSPSIGLPAGSSLTVAAGDVEFRGTALLLPVAQVQIAATGPAAVAIPLAPSVDAPPEPLGGALQMTDSQLSVTAPGNVLLRAGNLDLRQSTVAVLGSSLLPDGDPGAIAAYAAGDMSLRSSWLMSSTYNAAPGAAIKLAARTLLIDGAGGLTTQTQGGSGNAGAIRVAVDGPMTLLNGAVIESTSTDAGGNAGGISISAKSLGIDGADSGINSIAHNSTGSAGSVNVRVTGDLTLSNGGTIASLAFGAHNGGAVALDVGGALTMVNGASVTGGTAYSDGDAGPMSIKADSINIDGAGDFAGIDNSTYYGSGKAGAIDITVTRGLALANGGRIQSASQAGGKAGTITIKAAALDILGSPDIATAITTDSASGNSDAGAIAITADRISIARAGQISSSTHSTGAGGSVVIRTGTLTIDGSGYDGGTGIASRTADGSGNAGAVDIVATGDITLLRGGIVTSRTEGAGAAGTVTLAAGTLTIDGGTVGAGRTGIFGSARAGSSGQTGQVTVSAGDLALRNDGLLSLRNDATVTDPGSLVPTTLRVAANNLLIDHAAITAEATGNADASNIAIVATNAITLKSSSITTSAVDGNGGDIRLAGQTIRLADSLVTTSVLGATNGNGGSIRVAGNALVLQSGFIQANTLAPLARGGNIVVDTSLLLPEGGTLALGGDAVQSFHSGYAGFNVIQAAAPGGASGMLQVTTPELNLAGTLTALETPTIDFGPLARDQCRTGAGSSFTVTGSGVPPATRVGSGQ